MMMMMSACDNQHVELNFYNASSLKQQAAFRNVATLGHIMLIPNQPVFFVAVY
jgi:hypothetical protein